MGQPTPGHPERDLKRAIENTSGPLGQGHAMALGAAIAERFMVERFGEWMAHKTFAFISDGGIQEEVSQGVGRIAGHLGLHNFIMFYDSNNIQLSTKVDEVSTEDIVAKYEAWGWNVISIDGNDGGEIRMALTRAVNETEKPTLIVGHTVMGKGALGKEGESFENKVSTHGQPLTAAGADIAKTVANLGGDPENPFVIFDDVKNSMPSGLPNCVNGWRCAAKRRRVGPLPTANWPKNSTSSFPANCLRSITSASSAVKTSLRAPLRLLCWACWPKRSRT